MDSRVAKKRRITPSPTGTISSSALASPYLKQAAMVTQVRRLQREVRSMKRDQEIKSFDTTLSFNFDTTGEIPASGQLCLVPQGTTSQTRIGEKIVVKSVQIRASIGLVPSAATVASSTACLYLIWDKQANGAAAGVTDIFTGTNVAEAMKNITNLNRFKILAMWYHTFSPKAGAQGAYNNDQYHLELYKKVNIPMIYNSTTGAITEITGNNIFLVAGTDAATDDTIVCSGRARIVFTE